MALLRETKKAAKLVECVTRERAERCISSVGLVHLWSHADARLLKYTHLDDEAPTPISECAH